MKPDEIKKLIQTEARRIAEEVYTDRGTRFGVSTTPTHTHNNIDALQMPFISNISNQGNGVLSRTQLTGFIKGLDSIAQTIVNTTTNNSNFFPVTIPIPVINGFGTTTADTMTGSPVAGATSATLTGAWAGTTGRYASRFGAGAGGEMRKIQFTNGSTSITWDIPLVENTASTSLLITGNSRFLGGEAPAGTIVGFVNADDGLSQIWVKQAYDTDPINKWSGFDFTVLSP